MIKKKFLEQCLTQRIHFTPFVVSCEGLLGKGADTLLKRLSKKLADKWCRLYSPAVSFVNTRFAISLVGVPRIVAFVARESRPGKSRIE